MVGVGGWVERSMGPSAGLGLEAVERGADPPGEAVGKLGCAELPLDAVYELLRGIEAVGAGSAGVEVLLDESGLLDGQLLVEVVEEQLLRLSATKHSTGLKSGPCAQVPAVAGPIGPGRRQNGC